MALFSKASVNPLWDVYVDIEHEFIMAVAALLGNEDRLQIWMDSPFRGQQELRRALDDIINRHWNKTIRKDLKGAFELNAKTTLESDEKIYRLALEEDAVIRQAIPIKQSATLQRILETGYLSVEQATMTANTIARASTIARLNQATLSVATGQVSLTQAIKKAAQEMADEGVAGYIYPSGATIGLPEYIRREVVTQVMNTTRELTFARANEWGSDLIQISSHAGARPGCFPYQGRVYSRPGTTVPGYPSLDNDTSYGEPAGIFGINCRHFSTPWFEGINDLMAAAEKDPAKSEHGMNNEKLYDLTQEQRFNERQIRAWKRRAALQEEAGLDPGKARRKIKEWQVTQRDFLKENPLLRRQYEREAA